MNSMNKITVADFQYVGRKLSERGADFERAMLIAKQESAVKRVDTLARFIRFFLACLPFRFRLHVMSALALASTGEQYRSDNDLKVKLLSAIAKASDEGSQDKTETLNLMREVIDDQIATGLKLRRILSVCLLDSYGRTKTATRRERIRQFAIKKTTDFLMVVVVRHLREQKHKMDGPGMRSKLTGDLCGRFFAGLAENCTFDSFTKSTKGA